MYKKKNLRYILLPAFLIFILVLVSCAESPESRIKLLEQQGDIFFQKGNYIAALKKWNAIIKTGEADADTYDKIGLAQKKLGNLTAALGAFRQCIKLDPSRRNAWQERIALEIFFLDITAATESLKYFEKLGRSSEFYILSGDLMCVQGKYDEAEEKYRTLLSVEPNNEAALARLSFCLLLTDNKSESMKIYHRLQSLSNKHAETLASMSRYQHVKGDNRKAKKLILKAIAMEPDNFELHVRLADFYLDDSDYLKARSVFIRIFNKNPDNNFAKKMIIETSLLAYDMKKAEKILFSLSVDEKKDMEYALLLGKYFLLNHNFPQAVSYFQYVIDQEPDLVIAHYLLGITYLSMGHGNLGKNELIKTVALNKTFADSEIALADYYYKKEQYDVAEEYAARVKEREPENYRAFLMLGNIYLISGKEDNAILMYRTAKALNPALLSPDYFAAIIASSALPVKKVRICYQNFFELCPQCLDAAYEYAMLLAQHGEEKKAMTFLQGIDKEHPEDPWPQCICGEVYFQTGKHEKAIRAFRNAVSLDPTILFAYERLIKLMLHGKKERDLEKILESALMHNADFAGAYTTLADIYVRTGRQTEAVTLLEKAIRKIPGDPQIANNLAWYYLMPDTRNLAKAFSLALKANEWSPERPEIMDTLAWVYYLKGMYAQAHWLLKCCLEQGGDIVLTNYHLGLVYAAEGQAADAGKYLSIALKNGADGVYKIDIKNALKKLSEREAVMQHP